VDSGGTAQQDRRVTHPTGFSIVKPPGWLERIAQKGGLLDDAIYLRANDKKIRFSPHICVTSHDHFSLSAERGHPHYVSNYVETEFLKFKTYVPRPFHLGQERDSGKARGSQ
jgi:hypothetical protein